MEIGAFAMFDALGTKGIWERNDPAAVVAKFAGIATRLRAMVDADFGGPGHPNSLSPTNCMKMVRVGFVSDTVVTAFANKDAKLPVFAIMMAARYAGEVVRLGLQQPARWAYRGVVSYGEFEIHDSGGFFVGPAVDEAASCYERADAAVIWLTSSAKALMAHANDGDFQGAMSREEHDVPLKAKDGSPTSYRTYVTSPFDFGIRPDEAACVVDCLLGTFDLTKPGVPEKRRNTEAFLQRHLAERVKTWQEQQALLRKFGVR